MMVPSRFLSIQLATSISPSRSKYRDFDHNIETLPVALAVSISKKLRYQSFLQHNLHERHQGPDVDGRQDQLEGEDSKGQLEHWQPSTGIRVVSSWRQQPPNADAAKRVFANGLLGSLERVRNISMQTLHTRDKVCKVCMPDICRLVHSGKVCKVCQMQTFPKKSVHKACMKSASNLHKICKSARVLHKVCIRTGFFSGEIPRFLKLQTYCKLNADFCMLYADTMRTSIKVCIWLTISLS
jgi:hypothetical protein